MTLKKNILLLLLLTYFTTTLCAKSFYVKVASVTRSEALFSIEYDLQALGFKTYIAEHNEWYRVYTGPYKNTYHASMALKKIQKNISKDAYITSVEVKGNKIITTPVETPTVTATPIVTSAPTVTIIQKTNEPVAVVSASSINSSTQESVKIEYTKEPIKSDSKSLEGDFFVGVSIGASKFDITTNGNLPLDITMRSYGPSYGFEGGYYFLDNVFMTLNYQRTDLRHSYFDAGFVTLNYQLDKIGTLSPYAGLLLGTGKINWKTAPVVGGSAPSALYSAIGGMQVGGDIELFGSLSTYMYYRYIMMDFNTLISESSLSSEIKHNSQQDFNLGLKYSF